MKNHWLAQAQIRKSNSRKTLSSRFLNESMFLDVEKSGLLKGLDLDGRWNRIKTAVLLQSHRLRNEGGCWCGQTH